jgi:serine protease inhibitor
MNIPPRVTPLVIGLLLASCGDATGPEPGAPILGLPRDLSAAEAKLIEADNHFALKLFREINRQEGDTNVFVSPLSVAMALGMTYNGADGATQQAMQQALELMDMSLEEVNQSYRDLIDLLVDLDPLVEVLIANSIWYRENLTLEEAFLHATREFFDARVSALDFGAPEASDTINGWVREHTKGLIEEIVPPAIPANIVMYLINAIYFKGDWASPFDRDLTQAGPFTLESGAQTTTDMMWHAEAAPVGYLRQDGVAIVDLPYGGRAFSMTILVPEGHDGIDQLLASMTVEQWASWMAGIDSTDLIVSMPKFTLEYELGMNDVLSALGMDVAFTSLADFSKMFAPGGIWIDEVKHKAVVQVDEEGTTAAAVTSVSMTDSAPMPFVVDRPFVFVIREKYSGTVLFMGKVMDPTGG